ncbi:uncharacterized protein BCR38DRAFT_484211 [Pseudomassariella vexata]|uniref:Uncharacterized protein n=1 Tax=Pseudomassariella vexata TaxID=1141098 RepID=A0A1Y2E6V4_9PEZI|nr:uncharacterized protein BCR38DRAFT_484211 [Pseudomassariella vexata]ORY66595.1 hypothetical protein BCR38DRAFT_484211 [Pseudomassariella vexata]
MPENLEPIGYFQDCEDHSLDVFDTYQFQLLAPYFELMSPEKPKAPHYYLAEGTVLPFIEDSRDAVQHGGSADVGALKSTTRVTIVQLQSGDEHNPSYAIKQLHSRDREAFKQEVFTLKRLIPKVDTHLIKLS